MSLPLCQIAFSVTDLRRTHTWYHTMFGFCPSGGTNLFFGPLSAHVQGVPKAASTCWWLMDRQEFFQLEFFEFRSPHVRPLPPDWRPCDIGYTMVGLHVADLEATLARLRDAGTLPLTDPIGRPGARRVCVRDPEGVLLELMEDDPRAGTPRPRPRPDVPVAVRSITLSVPDIDRSQRFFVDILGLSPADDVTLHGPEHAALWGLGGAQFRTAVLWADDMLVELVQYTDPVGRPRPANYRISDQGLLNIAFGFHSKRDFDTVYARCTAAGHRGNWRPLVLGAWSVVYVNDDQGFSVELLHVQPWYEKPMGFAPRPVPRLAPFVGRTPKGARAGKTFARALVTGAAGGIGSELARCLAADGTHLVLLDRNAAGLEQLAAELRGQVSVDTAVVDQADLERFDATARALAGRPEPIDLLVACAGVDNAYRLTDFDWRGIREDFAVNTLSNLVLLSALVPTLLTQGRGHVAVLVSLGGLLGFPFESAYSASKAALGSLVESARAELEPKGVTFTAIYPGFIDTPMARNNAFKKPSMLPVRDATERIYDAILDRRPTLHFPRSTYLQIVAARLLPVRLRDRIARDLMNLS